MLAPPAAGLPPTVHVFNALIAACDRGQQYERAMGIAREMSRAGVQPNAITQQVRAPDRRPRCCPWPAGAGSRGPLLCQACPPGLPCGWLHSITCR